MAGEETQFDALLGGSEQLPSSLTLAKFVASRSQEIQIMKNALATQSGTKLAFQGLPKHMRRRAMSHNVKRLPRRLRQIHLNQMKKSGMPAKQKRPSRKYRRRPRNLLEEYTRRSSKKCKWLPTHIWHAKRFHMVAKWGFKLPYQPCDKAFRACYRAMSQHCLLQDISYLKCIEILGDKTLIIENLTGLCKPGCGVGISSKAFINGKREGQFVLHDVDLKKAIGNVTFQWHPNDESKLWLWIHPAFYEIANTTLKECFKHLDNIVLNELDSELSRFRLTGPLSNSVLRDTLVSVKTVESVEPKLQQYITSHNSQQIFIEQCNYWETIGNASPSDISPHLIIGLIVNDPRMYIPKKRTKSVPETTRDDIHDVPNNIAQSPLWDKDVRVNANNNKPPDSEIAELRSKLLVPGSDLNQSGASVPIILIQQPGNRTNNIGLGSSWDIILPTVWAKPFWVAFVMRGARVGGLRESGSILFEMGKSQFLEPDTEAGMVEEMQITTKHKENFFKKPPNKRINYNKFNIVSPFSCNWKLLMKEWSGGSECNNFTVLKDRNTLNAINLYLNSPKQHVPDHIKSFLIPVRLECEKSGCPSQFAIICLPKYKKDFNTPVTEPICEDKFQLERKAVRQEHHSLLKKLRKRRKLKSESLESESYRAILTTYTKKMRALWLPEPIAIRNCCCREIIGFVTKGAFSFAVGKGAATGYIISDCLPILTEFKSNVLYRNTNTRQYRQAKLSIIVE